MNDLRFTPFDRKYTQPCGCRVVSLRCSQQQKHVAGLDWQQADAVAEPASISRNAQKRDRVFIEQAEAARRAPVDPRTFGHNRFGQGQPACIDAARMLFRSGKFQRTFAHEGLNRFRFAFDDDEISGADILARGKSRKPFAPANQTQDVKVMFVGQGVKIGDSHFVFQRLFAHAQFGDIAAFGEFGFMFDCALARGQKAPANQGNEGDPGDGHHKAHRRKVEHAEGFAKRVLTVFGNDDIGRRADQGDHAAQDRREGQGHQRLADRAFRLGGRFDIKRHQKCQGGDVVDDGRHARPDHGHHGDMQGQRPVRIQKPGGQFFNRARPDEATRHDQDQRDDGDGRMPETREDIGFRHQPKCSGQHQCAESDKVIPNAPPNKQGKKHRENSEDQSLVTGHVFTNRFALR